MVGLWGTLFLFFIFGLIFVNSQNVSDSEESWRPLSGNGSRFCIEIQSQPLSSEEKNYLIWFHNSLRGNVSKRVSENLPKAFFMKKITWNNTLEEMAKNWADECKEGKDVNLIKSIGQHIVELDENASKVKLKNLLQTWKGGLSQLTPDIIGKYRNPNRDEYNHEALTQILWWNTDHFGCGRSVYKQERKRSNSTEAKTIVKLVCNYSPVGNKVGEPVYMTEKSKGLICTYDPQNSYCTSEQINKTREKNISGKNRTEELEKERNEVEYRIRSRMIELWPAAANQVNAWQTFNIKFFYICLTTAILPYFNAKIYYF